MTLEELRAEADKMGYKLVKKKNYTCICNDPFPRMPSCVETHEFVRQTRKCTYCRKKGNNE